MLKTRADKIAVGLLVALVAVWVSPFFLRVHVQGAYCGAKSAIDVRPAWPMADLRNDSNNHYTHLALARMNIVRFGQAPWRTHLAGGGVYLLGHPRDGTFSPVFLPVLLFGEVWGLKITVAAVYFVGALGMYYLCRVCLGFGPLGSFYAGAMMVVAAWLQSRLYHGSYDEWHFMLFPLILAFFKQARRNWRYAIGAGMLLYVVMYDGKYVLPILFLYLGLFAAAEVARYLWRRERRWWEPIPRLAGIAVLVVLLGAVKIVPLLSVLNMDDTTRITPYTVPKVPWAWVMLPEKVGEYLDYVIVDLPQPPLYVVCTGMGPTALVIALVGFAAHPRRLAGWFLFAVLGVWISLYKFMPVDLYRLLWHLPLFHSIKEPLKYFNWSLLFCLCVMGGRLISTVAGPRRRLWPVLAAIGLTVGALEAPFFANGVGQKRLFAYARPPLERQPDFYPVVATNLAQELRRQRNDYAYVKRNIGIVNWYCPMDLSRAAEPKVFLDARGESTPNAAYRGEAHFLLPGNRAEMTELTPNRLTVSVAVDTPDTLIINQNYDWRWTADVGAITSVHMDTPAYLLIGLDDEHAWPFTYDRTRREFRQLAVRLEAPGRYDVTLRYRPWDGYIGAAVSALTWIGCLVLLIRGRRRRRRESNSPEAARAN